MSSFKAVLDDAPLQSVNAKYNKNFSLTKAYRESKKFLIDYFYIMNRGNETMTGKIRVIYFLECYVDIDNYEKVLFDSLEGSGVVHNDKEILSVEKIKIPIKLRTKKKLGVYVYEMTDKEYQERKDKICDLFI